MSVLMDYGKGLGDHIRFNAIVQEYAARNDRVGIFSIQAYAGDVAFLYRDMPQVRIHIANNMEERERVMGWRRFFAPEKYDRVLHLDPPPEHPVQHERLCYALAGVDFNKRWDNFHFTRDHEREKECYQALVTTTPYAFVHDDKRFSIDPARMPTLPAVRPTMESGFGLFEYGLVLERAAEVHVMDSSFMLLVDQLPYDNPTQKLFVHRYARPNLPSGLPILRKPWTILGSALTTSV